MEEPQGKGRLRPVATSLSMGFTAGAPFIVVVTLVQAWLRDGGVPVEAIGLFALARLPYSLKFLWAPLLDCTAPFGCRRKGWLLLSQASLALALLSFGSAGTASALSGSSGLWAAALSTLWVSFSSATQDIAVDAYRREDLLTEKMLADGSTAYLWGYRLGMVALSGGGLVAADVWGWDTVFRLAALLMLAGPATLLWSPEPAASLSRPRTLSESVKGPLLDFLARDRALLILAFVLLYRLGEQLAASLNTVFFMEAGYTKTEIGLVVKAFGLTATLAGVSLANIVSRRAGNMKALWIFGWLQPVNMAALTALWVLPPRLHYLAFFVALDHVIVGGAGLVFTVYLSSLTRLRYTATQYAILTSVMALPANVLASPAGWLVSSLGWPGFYLLGAVLALPGLALLRVLRRPAAPSPPAEAAAAP
ncbi:MAG: AmpG family muropeptide MFS transporter [Deltaproteobacteria bacterium]|jgi:PAT family beta-lactamase induction signal transducer AmpG|nr:AmpG family muropeptide MFS transporter [Deltaproteobacteria bacterium]